MRHLARTWAGIVAVACLPFAVAAQNAAPTTPTTAPAARPAQAPRYNWIQADYVSSYIGESDFRIASKGGFKLTTNLLLAKPFYFTGSYGTQFYDFTDGIDDIEIDDMAWSAGAGVFLPLAPNIHVTGAATWEAGEFDIKSSAGDGTEDASGYGLELALRAQVTPSAEVTGSYKYRDQKLEFDDGTEVDRIGQTFGASVIANISPQLGLVLKIERSTLTAEFDDGDEDTDIEAYSIGLRFRI